MVHCNVKTNTCFAFPTCEEVQLPYSFLPHILSYISRSRMKRSCSGCGNGAYLPERTCVARDEESWNPYRLVNANRQISFDNSSASRLYTPGLLATRLLYRDRGYTFPKTVYAPSRSRATAHIPATSMPSGNFRTQSDDAGKNHQ